MTSNSTERAIEAPASALLHDAPVSVYGGLVFATTGQCACDRLGEAPTQIALTPVVAERIAEVLRVILQYPDLVRRQAILDVWSADEASMIPHGRVLLEEHCLRVGIEPLGAGATVALQYEHVPAFVVHLEKAAAGLRG